MSFIIILLLVLALIGVVDWYAFSGLKSIVANSSDQTRRIAFWLYGISTGLTFLGFVAVIAFFQTRAPWLYRVSGYMFGLTIAFFVGKLILILPLFGFDITNGVVKLAQGGGEDAGFAPSRRKFVAQMGLAVAAIPFSSMIYGMIRGKYAYTIHRLTLKSKDLPEAFHGFTLAQLSDVHSGSFDNQQAVAAGIQMVMDEKPDTIVFTGDLVNEHADEFDPWVETFSKLDAPYGMYSTLGNHDYAVHGSRHLDQNERRQHFEKLFKHHKDTGFKLLNNEHVRLEKDGQHITLAGVENWGEPPFPQEGDLDKALAGAEESPFRILLSHDPTHWDHKVLPHDQKIHLTLSGHTHGMQFGIEVGGFKWSPVKYRYPRWAGLYQQGEESLYVNRGFGFIGFPGRVGIWPEITIITLEKA